MADQGQGARLRPALRAGLLLAAALLLLTRLGATDLWAPDEPRYGQVAEEMRSMRHGPVGLVRLHLAGEVYTQKPPLYYWLAALAGTPFGRVSETAARLPSALAGILVVALTMAFGARLFGPRAGLLAAALLLTSWQFAHLARRVQLDVLLTLFETAALVGFYRLDRGVGSQRVNIAVVHGAMGLAVLTKGPVGFLIPMLVITLFLAWERRLTELRRVTPPWAFALSIGPGLLWLAAASLSAPQGYLDQAVGTNVFGRFFAGTAHARPFYYYVQQFPLGAMPWTLLWPLVWVAGRRVFRTESGSDAARTWRFLLAWVAASFVFFSLSTGKRGLYMLPTYPAVALLCADAALRRLAHPASMPRPLRGALLTCLAAAGSAALWVGLAPTSVAARLGYPGAELAIPVAFAVAGAGSAVLAAAAWLWLGRSDAPALARVAVAIAFFFSFELATFSTLFPALDAEKSPRPIALAAREVAHPGERIGLVGNRALVGGLVYYGAPPVVELLSSESIREYLERGGRTIVVDARDLERVAAVTRYEIRLAARSGKRRLLVVEALPDTPEGDTSQ